MATNAHTNAAIYCRVSTRQQAEDGSSLDSQEVACRRLAASQGFTVTQVFKEDFPGTELARPLLDQLRAGVRPRGRCEPHAQQPHTHRWFRQLPARDADPAQCSRQHGPGTLVDDPVLVHRYAASGYEQVALAEPVTAHAEAGMLGGNEAAEHPGRRA